MPTSPPSPSSTASRDNLDHVQQAATIGIGISMQRDKPGNRSVTFIHGPTIRGGSGNAAVIRSKLMRQRRWEKQGRLSDELTKTIGDAQKANVVSNVSWCRCGRSDPPVVASSALKRPASSQPTTANLRQLQPRPALSELDSSPGICPRCFGIRADGALISPSTLVRGIGNSQMNPFFPDRSAASSHFDLLLHHYFHVVGPIARPTEFAERTLQAYLDPARSPIVLQAMLYSSSLHLDALPIIRGATKRVHHTAQNLRLKGSVMNQLREKLSTVNSSNIHEDWVDDILMGILYLAANENLDQIRPPGTSPFAPPFRTLQSMEFYGSCEFHPLHWQTVQHIILQRGGLATVKLYGLPWLISISGLIVAVNENCKPTFPLISPDGKLFTYRAPIQALSIRTPARHVTLRNHGFRQLSLLWPPIKGTIIRVFLDLCEMVQALDTLAGHPCGAKVLTQIGDVRTSVLHRLCSLPDQHDRASSILHKRECTPEEQAMSTAIYMICRKAALLYAANVVLPLPRTSALRCKMTADIYNDMREMKVQKRTEQMCEILLWCTVIGGICSDSSPAEIRASFIDEAREYCARLGIDSWEPLLELLQSFAWLDCASDDAGKAIWGDINASRKDHDVDRAL